MKVWGAVAAGDLAIAPLVIEDFLLLAGLRSPRWLRCGAPKCTPRSACAPPKTKVTIPLLLRCAVPR